MFVRDNQALLSIYWRLDDPLAAEIYRVFSQSPPYRYERPRLPSRIYVLLVGIIGALFAHSWSAPTTDISSGGRVIVLEENAVISSSEEYRKAI